MAESENTTPNPGNEGKPQSALGIMKKGIEQGAAELIQSGMQRNQDLLKPKPFEEAMSDIKDDVRKMMQDLIFGDKEDKNKNKKQEHKQEKKTEVKETAEAAAEPGPAAEAGAMPEGMEMSAMSEAPSAAMDVVAEMGAVPGEAGEAVAETASYAAEGAAETASYAAEAAAEATAAATEAAVEVAVATAEAAATVALAPVGL